VPLGEGRPTRGGCAAPNGGQPGGGGAAAKVEPVRREPSSPHRESSSDHTSSVCTPFFRLYILKARLGSLMMHDCSGSPLNTQVNKGLGVGERPPLDG
jgi:hypothetical protein